MPDDQSGAGPLRVLVIGLGGRSAAHLQAIRRASELELVAACDMDRGRADRFQNDYGLPVYLDAAEALAKCNADIVAICTRETPRYALAQLAIDAGVKAIVLEKPMTADIGQARTLVRRCKERGIVLTAMHQMRFSDEFVAAKNAIAAGEIGEPYYVRAVSYGHLMEQGPHMVDMVLYLLGEPEVDWVMGQVADLQEGLSTVHIAPAFVTGYVAFKNGVRASLECGRLFPPALGVEGTWLQKRVQVLGTKGVCDAMVAHYCRVINESGGVKTLSEGPDGWNASTCRHYDELARVLIRGGEHRNGAEPSLNGFEIIQGIYQSAVVRDRVTLPIAEGAKPIETLMAPVQRQAAG